MGISIVEDAVARTSHRVNISDPVPKLQLGNAQPRSNALQDAVASGIRIEFLHGVEAELPGSPLPGWSLVTRGGRL